ncbi:MAG: hypothetical protein BWY71_01713 [Planctomycetes bacterium ADurb.Bin412]|nr:MAG: hypothetical protein BWY71_01713 [Planctomycetes bacterium ADurb.Bin412]
MRPAFKDVVRFRFIFFHSRPLRWLRFGYLGFGLFRADGLGPLGAVPVNCQGLQPQPPAGHIGLFDVLHRTFVGHIDGLADGPADKRLNRRHHADMGQVRNGPFPFGRFKGTVKHRQMFRFQNLGGFNRVILFDLMNDFANLIFRIAQLFQGHPHGLIDDLEHTAAGQQFIFDQGDIRFDAGGIAVHHETDGPGWGQHGYLAIAIAVQLAHLQCCVPAFLRRRNQIRRTELFADIHDRRPVHPDNAEHMPAVDFILIERSQPAGQFRTGGIGCTRHDCRNRRRQMAPFLAVVGQSQRHHQRAQIRIAQPQRPEIMRVLRNLRGGVTAVIDQQFLRDNQNPNRLLQALDIDAAVVPAELHQIQAGQIARGIVQEHIFAARVAGIDPSGFRAGVPVVDGRVILYPRIAAYMRAVRDQIHHFVGIIGIHRLTGCYPDGLKATAGLHRLHKLIRQPHREIGILEHDTAIGLAVETAIISLFNQGPGFLFFFDFAGNKFLDIRVVNFQRLHLRCSTGLSAAFHYRGNLVIHPHKAQRPGGFPSPAEFLLAGANGGHIGPGAAAMLEQHGLTGRQVHDVLHRIAHALNETGRRLRILIGVLTRLNSLRLAVPMEIVAAAGNPFDIVQPNIKPDRRIKSGILIHAQPCQLLIKQLFLLLAAE